MLRHRSGAAFWNATILWSACIFSFAMFAHASDLVLATEVLKGDTFIASFYGGKMKYVHVVCVDAPELNQTFGLDSRSKLSDLVLNKKLTLVVTHEDGDHVLAKVYDKTRDVGAELIKSGMAFPKLDETSAKTSFQCSSYKVLADRAQFSKIGVWKNADLHFAQSPSEWRKLDRQRYDQKCVNGTPNCPGNNGFNRPDLGSGVQAPQHQ